MSYTWVALGNGPNVQNIIGRWETSVASFVHFKSFWLVDSNSVSKSQICALFFCKSLQTGFFQLFLLNAIITKLFLTSSFLSFFWLKVAIFVLWEEILSQPMHQILTHKLQQVLTKPRNFYSSLLHPYCYFCFSVISTIKFKKHLKDWMCNQLSTTLASKIQYIFMTRQMWHFKGLNFRRLIAF